MSDHNELTRPTSSVARTPSGYPSPTSAVTDLVEAEIGQKRGAPTPEAPQQGTEGEAGATASPSTPSRDVSNQDWPKFCLGRIAQIAVIPHDRKSDLDYLRTAVMLAGNYAKAGLLPPPIRGEEQSA